MRRIGADGRQAHDLAGLRLDQGGAHGVDDAPGFGEAGLRIEFGRRQDENAGGGLEGGREGRRVVHLGHGDLAAVGPPFGRFCLAAQHGANIPLVGEQGARQRAADLAGDSGDGIHRQSPMG